MSEDIRRCIEDIIPVPACIVNREGKIIENNSRLEDVFIYSDVRDYDFFALTGFKTEELLKGYDKGVQAVIERNSGKFKLIARAYNDGKEEYIYVFFVDVTDSEELKNKYAREQICVARVELDNFDELKANIDADMRMTLESQADRIIRKWAQSLGGAIDRIGNYSYIIYFHKMYAEEPIKSKFPVLDEIRSLGIETDLPISISIGLGIGGKNISETREFADSSLDLALGRGGDQAVVRTGNRFEYFGGKSQSVEKGNKGKSRVIAHALQRLIDKAGRIVIMGHYNPDMDALGSALGVFRICKLSGKNASIVVNEVSDSLQTIYKRAKDTERYNFIDNKKAIELVDKDTLLIVLDTHRPSYVECKELLDMTEHVVVIDHHRRAIDAIKKPELSYIESYASSTAELVTEILQYSAGRKALEKLEAEALLAGMTIDTNRFAVKTGVRTFEAAAWLRRAGADTAEVKKLFQTDLDDFKTRSKAFAAAHIGDDGIASSICEGYNQEAQIINSQVADELLNVRGVKASFVAGRDETGRTVVSARSLGDINVQLIMEKLGGGGHLTTAGAQVEESPEDVIKIIYSILGETEEQE